ncbi:Predicted type IV restriction endonuclease [uncultured Clostridium sp.]|uniref:tyrosine-type recombinase/integrase n=1 Tax=uncultured Clostridium sp. TaxID=59620 RepID=UPI0008222AC6|nr:tyrosine-type recombinase/integrase [uncultured Clostridium sp.]SCI99276.1 Predicted type IV restriction endonuclease [uncultured Clostridium sp.]
MINDLKEIIKHYSYLPANTNEETIKINIVLKILDILGYDPYNFLYEDINLSGKSDILISINTNEKLLIETKRKNYNLKDKDVNQLCNYMTSQNIEWGILTNGNDYLLINKNIFGTSNEKICFRVQLVYNKLNNQISKTNNRILFNYLSYENIFIKHSTKYLCYFKSYTNKLHTDESTTSRKQYFSAILRFINYLTDTNSLCDESLLSYISLKKYMYYYANSKDHKKDTLINQTNYIVAFLKHLESDGTLHSKYFNNFDARIFVLQLDYSENSNSIENLKINEVKLLLNYFNKQKKILSFRNKLLIKLFLFTAPSIEMIKNITLQDIDLKNGFININSIRIKLPNSIYLDLQNYIEERNRENIKTNYLFYTKYRNEYRKMSNTTIITTISDSFNSIAEISESRRKELSLNTLQKSVIYKMLKNNFSIEEISAITGTTIQSISKYIDSSLMKERIKNLNKNLNSSKHPYHELLE